MRHAHNAQDRETDSEYVYIHVDDDDDNDGDDDGDDDDEDGDDDDDDERNNKMRHADNAQDSEYVQRSPFPISAVHQKRKDPRG